MIEIALGLNLIQIVLLLGILRAVTRRPGGSPATEDAFSVALFRFFVHHPGVAPEPLAALLQGYADVATAAAGPRVGP